MRQHNTDNGAKPFRHPVISVGKYPYEVEAHPAVQDDEISLNRLQRRSSLLRPGDKVKVAPFIISESKELSAVMFGISLLSHRRGIKEIDTDNLTKCLMHNHEGQFFARGHSIAMDFEGAKLILRVDGLMMDETETSVSSHTGEPALASGRLLSNTHLAFRMRIDFSTIKCIGTKTRKGFLDTMWMEGTPKHLIDLLHDNCFDAIRAHKFITLNSKRDIGTDLMRYALEIMAPVEVVHFLVERYPGVLAKPDSRMLTPLHHACTRSSSLEVVLLLLEKYPTALRKRSLGGNNPLHLACLSDDAPAKEVLEVLFQNFRGALAEKNRRGWTPLHCACATRVSAVVVQSLVKAFPAALEMKDSNGCLPLHLSCTFSPGYDSTITPDIVHILLEENPSTAKEINMQQQTPLHCACWWSPPVQVIQLLVEKYPQAIKVKDCNFLTPLEVVDGLFAAQQENANQNTPDAEISQLLAVLQSALDPDILTSEVLEFLIRFNDTGWRSGVGLILNVHYPKLHHLRLNDCLMPELMALIRQHCKLITMFEAVKGMPGLFESS